MNSIFFRIYAGMIAAILFVGAFTYGGVLLVNSIRSDHYRETMATGTFKLMALGLQRQRTPDELDRWKQVLGRLMGAEVEVLRLDDLDLEESELEVLAGGHVLMRLNDQQGHADIYFQLPDEDRLLYTRMTRVSEQQARATALLVLDELSQYPVESWDEEFERIRGYFGFDLRRVPFTSLNLDREQLQRLERREVVIAIDDNTGGQSAVTVYAPIGSTGQVLRMGPLRLFERYPVEMLLLAGIIGLSAMGVAAYLLVRPLQARLHRLGHAVEQLGEGDLEVRATVDSDDAVGQLAATFNGMTEHIRRLIESQREMTRAVSHELRTPVARLRFGIEILAGMADAERRQAQLEDLDKDIDELDELIDEILTFARLEEGAPTIQFDQVQMVQLLERLSQELTQLSGDLSLEVDRAVLAQVPPEDYRAVGSERYLHRVLQNLVTNAMRYARTRVRMRYYTEEDLAVLEVDDDGPGVPEEDRERVFKPFARLDESRHRKSGGYGLGLSIVQRIVEWHGGEIRILESDLGGARFRMTWPRQRPTGGHLLVGQAVPGSESNGAS